MYSKPNFGYSPNRDRAYLEVRKQKDDNINIYESYYVLYENFWDGTAWMYRMVSHVPHKVLAEAWITHLVAPVR